MYFYMTICNSGGFSALSVLGRVKTPFYWSLQKNPLSHCSRRFRLWQWLFTWSCLHHFSFWPVIPQRAGCVSPVFCLLYMEERLVTALQLQVYKSGFQSSFLLALLFFVFLFSISSVLLLLLIYFVFPFPSDIQWYCAASSVISCCFFLQGLSSLNKCTNTDTSFFFFFTRYFLFTNLRAVLSCPQQPGVSAFTQ